MTWLPLKGELLLFAILKNCPPFLLIEDEATVKTFYKEKGYVRLQPQFMDPIIVRSNHCFFSEELSPGSYKFELYMFLIIKHH